MRVRRPRSVAVARGGAGRCPGAARVRRVRHALRRQALRPLRSPELLRRAVPARGLGAPGCLRGRAGRRVRGVRAGGDHDGAAVWPRAVRGLRVRASGDAARPAQVRGAGRRQSESPLSSRTSSAARAARGRRRTDAAEARRRSRAAERCRAGRPGRQQRRGATLASRVAAACGATRFSRTSSSGGAPGPGRLRRPAAACDLRVFWVTTRIVGRARRRRGDVARSGPPAR